MFRSLGAAPAVRVGEVACTALTKGTTITSARVCGVRFVEDMPVLAVGLVAVASTTSQTGATHIFGMRDQFEVVGIHARRVVAGVINGEVIGNRPERLGVSESMRPYSLTCDRIKPTVPVGIGAGQPQPTRISALHFLPKPFTSRAFTRRHCATH